MKLTQGWCCRVCGVEVVPFSCDQKGAPDDAGPLCIFCRAECYGETPCIGFGRLLGPTLVDVDGIGRLWLDPSDFIDSVVARSGDWEPHHNDVLDAHVGWGSVVLDVGAHIGVFALKAARRGAARVYAWEPNRTLYERRCSRSERKKKKHRAGGAA